MGDSETVRRLANFKRHIRDISKSIPYKERMWFKLTYSLAGMHGREETDLPAEVAVGRDARIRLWTREVQHQGNTIKQFCCDAVIEREPPPPAFEALDGLKNRRLLLDDPPQVDLPYTSLFGTIVGLDGRIAPKWIIPLEIMPQQYQIFQRSVDSGLRDLAQKFITTLRWYQAASGRHNPFAHVSSEWSEDGATWYTLPSTISSRAEVLQGVDTRFAVLAEILSEGDEPFAHELIREARDLTRSAPRSALLIAMSAIETGLKHYVAYLVPNADSLLEKMPSPSPLTLLQEVIPAIHRSKEIHSQQIPLDSEARDYFRKWLAQRNQIAHGNKKTVDGNDILEFITFATDILYVLDYHRGHTWALARLTSGRIRTG